MLEDNTSLECLDIRSRRGLSLNNYFSALESLQTNTTLKTLRLYPNLASFGDAEMKRLISLAKKNYGLESLDEGLSAQDKTGELGTLLRLNDIGCLFYHLLESPLLCGIEHRCMSTGTITDGPVRNNKRPRTSK
jgi:hypothetical protein